MEQDQGMCKVWLIGDYGSDATTVLVGSLDLEKGLIPFIGMITTTESFNGLDLVTLVGPVLPAPLILDMIRLAALTKRTVQADLMPKLTFFLTAQLNVMNTISLRGIGCSLIVFRRRENKFQKINCAKGGCS